MVAADQGKVVNATTGTWTLTLPAVATAGDGFHFYFVNSGAGTITIDPNGAETIDGVATLGLGENQTCMVTCNGTQWRTVGLSSSAGGGGGSSGRWVQIEAQTVSGSPSSVDFTTGIDSTYDKYMLEGYGIRVNTDGARPNLRFSADGGSTWLNTLYRWGAQYVSTNGSGGGNGSDNDATQIRLVAITNAIGNQSHEHYAFTVEFSNLADAALDPMVQFWGVTNGNVDLTQAHFGGGHHETAQAIDGIRFLPSSGTLAAGEFVLSGRKVG